MEEPQLLRANAPLLLNQPDQLYLIQSGSVALFAVPLVAGHPEGERRYLFSCSSGEALLGSDAPNSGLLAVPIEPTQLSQQSLADLPQAERCSLLESWLLHLGQIDGLPQPGLTRPIEMVQFLSLMQGQIVQPPRHQIIWVQLQQGEADWLGLESLRLTPETGILPLAGSWLVAEGTVELSLQSTETVDIVQLQQGLTTLHRWLLEAIALSQTQAQQAAQQLFQQRQQLNRQAMQQTLHNLASVVTPISDSPTGNLSALLNVAGAIGRAIGVEIKPPVESDRGVAMRDPLEAIGRSSRLRLRRVLLRQNWWQQDCGALIAYRRESGDPVALLPMAGDHYELYDPSSNGPSTKPNQRQVVTAAVAATLEPRAFMFYRSLPHRALNAWDLLQFTLRGRKKDLLVFGLMGIGITLISLIFPLATGLLIDTALPVGDRTLLWQVSLGLLFAALGSAGLELIQGLAAIRLNTISEGALQAAVWDRLLQLKPTFFRDYAIGDLESRVSGISKIYRKLTGSTIQTLLSSLFALISFALMLHYSPQLAWVALPIALITIIFTVISGALLLRKKRPLLELEGDIFGLLVQLLGAVPKLRLAGAEERAFATWGKKYTARLKLDLSTQYIENSVTIFNTVMPTLTALLLFWLLVQLMQSGSGLSTGAFLAFSAAFGIFMSGITSLSNTLINVLEVVTLWQRSQPILVAEPEVDPDKSDPGKLHGQVVVDRVTFRYREDGPLTLDQVSLRADPGEFVAIVGPSGSGKSTLLRLLLGFDSPSDGTIYYDGQDLAGLEITAVRRQLGVVLQNSRMNAGTIFESISGNALIAMTEAWEAAEMAGLADDIRALPMGMHTFISEGGSNFSGGQRQRLMIARALALKPQLLLFDEATSALDNRTQAIVTDSLDQLGVTRIVIAHRLSTIRTADRIYVIQAGQVIQQGRFDELVAQPGLFSQLAARQLGDVPTPVNA